MLKIRKLTKGFQEVPARWLDEGWVDVFLEDWKRQTKGDVRSPSFIAECLPPDICEKLGAIWGLQPIQRRGTGNVCKMKNAEEENAAVEEFIRSVERDLGIRSDLSEDLQVNPKSSEGSLSSSGRGQFQKENPYLKFLKKTGGLGDNKRKKNLGRKAGKITKLIIQKFLEWYQSLGGNDDETFLEESTLENLFQIGFDMPAAKSLAIRTQELPTIPECLAVLINEPEHSPRYCLRQFLKQDMKLEKIPPKMFAFGRMLPKEKPSLRYKPPKNFVRKTWMECSRVPSDLDSMETVWGGLQKLRSTIAFSNWLKNHPEIKPPTYLEAQGLLKINYEEWNQMFKGFEMVVDTPAESPPSDTELAQDKISVQDPRGSSLQMDSCDSML